MKSRIKLVVFDWAGTTIDHGCLAPANAFRKLFEAHGVEATLDQARKPMGLEKRDHIRAMFGDATLAQSWKTAHGRAWSEADVSTLYHDFVPIQLAALEEHGALIPGAREALDYLRSKGIKTAGTTGYFESAARRVEEMARGQGFELDANAWAVEGRPGRPAPWMIFRNMEALGVFPPSAVLKIGDTVHDIAEGLNAGAKSFAVLRGGSEMGLTQADYDALNPNERAKRLADAAHKMRAAAADGVIESLLQLPELLEQI